MMQIIMIDKTSFKGSADSGFSSQPISEPAFQVRIQVFQMKRSVERVNIVILCCLNLWPTLFECCFTPNS